MKIQFTISDEMSQEVLALQSTLGMKKVEDLTIHAWKVLRFLTETIGHDCFTLSPEAIHWITQSPKASPVAEPEKDLPFTEIDTQILQEIHRLLDDNQLDQALKATHILKLLKSHTDRGSNSQSVQSEMLLTAAETFAAENDPEKAVQLIHATHETTNKPAKGVD
ncbi:hypothetical protein [Candidatus Nitrospira allomarina]|uniref:Uncharacterized protein n=1 Tax=Candidatus Nitrospira allomarina TaxID=3020900 RepID=A0AA96JQQ1_9BACT|nr:hypothetical protein [Candidatus Nitrospira allomarina]WNM56682.1 hypothetical protein PP769_11910 [Candidatus Nitrospira allomarina]